jgi:DNA-binding NarL/FixJ family response regulator
MLDILIADDHALLRMGLRELLGARTDWRVCGEATNGRQAVDMAEHLKPDVAVLDIFMPGLDGIQATRRIHEVSPPTAVLLLAGVHSDEMEEQSMAAGARGFVLKSNAEDRLIPAIESLSRPKTAIPCKSKPGGVCTECRSPCTMHLRARPASLTPREIEITRLLAEGKSNWCIATILGISVRTVETHRANVMQKLGLQSVVELVHFAIRQGMVIP